MIYQAISFTPEGGLAVRLINKTGAASVKGTIVRLATSAKGFTTSSADDDMPSGVVYDGGVADGYPCRVIVAGCGQVLMKNTVAAVVGYLMFNSSTAGRADNASTLPAVAIHNREIGHCLESVTGGTDVLAWCLLHFN